MHSSTCIALLRRVAHKMARVGCAIVLFVCLGDVVDGQAPGYPHGGAQCTDDYNCSYAGVCSLASSTSTSVCVCDAWATGPTCSLLNLAPATPGDGLQVPSYYSWGGHALEEDGLYHLFASFMCNHKTLGDWTTVSSVWRATARNITGPCVNDHHFASASSCLVLLLPRLVSSVFCFVLLSAVPCITLLGNRLASLQLRDSLHWR